MARLQLIVFLILLLINEHHEPMRHHLSLFLGTALSIAIQGCICDMLPAQDVPLSEQKRSTEETSIAIGTTRFLIVGKGKVADAKEMQERGVEAVERISKAARSMQPGSEIESLAENVMTMQQYRNRAIQERVTGEVFRDRLKGLIDSAKPQDTVVIYTHSHGCRNGFEPTQPLGGMVIDLPIKQLPHGGTMLWDEYTDLLLRIPAKNVIVLTMSCFSGGFVEFLDSSPVHDRWKDRATEGRNFIVVTSQNENLTSDPISKGTEIVNPFTYAVAKAFAGEADGFELVDGTPKREAHKDGNVSVGELIDYILYTSKNTMSDRIRLKNTADPKSTGSFHREDILFRLGE